MTETPISPISPKSPQSPQSPQHCSLSDLSTENSYMNFIKSKHPIMENYVRTFLNVGFTYKTAHKCLKDMYSQKGPNINKYSTPTNVFFTKLNDMIFNETVKINDNFVPQYYGDGTYYLHDTGSITKFLSDKTFTEFLQEIGIDDSELDHIIAAYPDIVPKEYIICLLHYVNDTLFPFALPEFDKNNIIRWGREHLRKHSGIDSYLLNYNSLKEFILTETNSEYINVMLGLLLEEFPHSKTVTTAKKLISTGIIGDNTAHARIYDVLKESNLEKCRKFISNSIIVAKKPKNLKINGSSIEFVSDKDITDDELLNNIIADMDNKNDTNSDEIVNELVDEMINKVMNGANNSANDDNKDNNNIDKNNTKN